MHPIFVQISGLIGLLIFLKELWSLAPFERTIMIAAATGFAVYLALILAEILIRRIISFAPPRLAEETAGPSGKASRKSEMSDTSATETA